MTNDLFHRLEHMVDQRKALAILANRMPWDQIEQRLAPEVSCISKGKASVKHEFGTKVSIAYSMGCGLIVGARRFPENPYDAHTLPDQINQTEIMLENLKVKPKTICIVEAVHLPLAGLPLSPSVTTKTSFLLHLAQVTLNSDVSITSSNKS